MYCPKCGQPQVTDQTRFCSKCGLPVSGLAAWIANSSRGLVALEEEALVVSASPRRKGIRRGAKLMFVSGVLLPLFFGLSLLVDGPGPLLILLVIFLAGLAMTLYSRLFGEDLPPPKRQPARPSGLGATSGNAALPPASSTQINSVVERPVRTAELVTPPSVTENTTRLLERE